MTLSRRLGLAFIGVLLASILLFMYIESGAQQAAAPRNVHHGLPSHWPVRVLRN